MHMAVATLGHLLALHVTPADEQDRAQVGVFCERMQEVTGEETFDEAAGHRIILEVVKLPEAKKGFVLLPRRRVVGWSFGGMARFRRLAQDYERLATTLAGLHYVALGMLMLRKAASILAVLSP